VWEQHGRRVQVVVATLTGAHEDHVIGSLGRCGASGDSATELQTLRLGGDLSVSGAAEAEK
jgi:hypothetical protein